jgi:hypothetical protein
MARLSRHKRGLLLARRYGFVSKHGVVYRKVPGRGLVKVKKSHKRRHNKYVIRYVKKHRRTHTLASLRRDLQAAIFELNGAMSAFACARSGSRSRLRSAEAFYLRAKAALRRIRR